MNFEDLYQDVVLAHSKRPQNFGPLPGATATARGDNPSCGDEIELAVILTPGHIGDLKFTGQGCAICMASASLMTVRVKGKSREEAAGLAEAFRQMLISPEEIEPPDSFGDLQVFKAIRRFPQRVKCATLAWRALEQVLSSTSGEAVTTE